MNFNDFKDKVEWEGGLGEALLGYFSTKDLGGLEDKELREAALVARDALMSLDLIMSDLEAANEPRE